MAVDFTKPLKRVNGIIVPQYWNDSIQDWEVLQGSDGAYKMQTPIDVNEDTFSGSANLVHSFTEDMHGLVISNDSKPDTPGAADITFTVNGKTRTVKAGDVWEGKLKAFRDFTINSAGVPWRADAIQTIGSVPVIVQPPVDTTAPANVLNLRVTNPAATSLTLNWDASSSSDVASYNVYQGNTLLGNVTGLAFNVTGLAASTGYTFWVKAKDGSNNEASGTSLLVTTNAPSGDSTVPANVASVTPSNITATGVTLTWPAATDNVAVSGYDIYNGSTFITTVNSGLTYTVAGLTAATAYTFWVKARDAAGNVASGTSVPVTTSAAPDTTAPTVTASPAAGTYTSAQSVTLTGTDDSGGAVTIYYTTDGSTPTQSSTVYSSGSPISVPATASIKFFGKDAAGNVSAVQTAAYTINTVTIPATPAVPTAMAGNNKVDLAWAAVSGATSYKIYRDGTLLASPTTNSYSDTTAVNGTTYSYTVSATNTAGESAQSTAVSATPVAIPATPTGLAATAGNAQVALTWNAMSGATSYKVYRDAVLLASPTAANYTDSTAVNGTAYSYAVSAVNGSGESAQSAAVSATPTAAAAYVTDQLSYKLGDPTYALFGGATYTGGILTLDGTAGYAYIDDSTAFDFGSGDFTIQTRVKFSKNGTLQMIFAQNGASTTDNSQSVAMFFDGGNRPEGRVVIGATQLDALNNSGTQMTDMTNFHDFALVRRGTTLEIYLDNALYATKTGVSGSVNNSTNKMALGRYGESTGSGFFLGGQMKSFLVYKKALSTTEMQQNSTAFA